ncbi:histidine phosphatase family protein [Rouxiella sp. WC2420]|uniref:Histidine phosphatase family protein n=1 Tax=Rouxiella sp. WC2420 TaxID=3234145 RepID=A0AB39VVQ2_9GAMM
MAQISQRMMHFLHNQQEAKEYQIVYIVSHGHVSQGVLAQLKEGIINSFSRYAQPNASYYVFELVDGKCTGLKCFQFTLESSSKQMGAQRDA